MIFIEIGLIGLGLYISAYVFYIVFLLLVNVLKRNTYDITTPPETRFAIIVPAHNEELFISRLIESLKNQSYPSDYYNIIVIADNCTDKTSEIATSYNVSVLDRNDNHRIGKGYAIKFAIDNINMQQYDAVFIIDSDSVVRNDALMHLNQNIKEDKKIIQCYNGIINPDDSWFTRLMNISRTISNEIFEPAKEKLGLSSHLMGNGMCFEKDIIKNYGWNAFSVGEDWEYYAKIIKGGERVAFANNVRVYHQESSSLKQATPQRIRWSSGRFAIIFEYGIDLFIKGIKEKDFLKISSSFPLVLPNPSLGLNITLIGFILSFILPNSNIQNIFFILFSCLILLQLVIFLSGIMYTKNKLKSFLSLFVAPLFLIWKMGVDMVSSLGIGRQKWTRTERKI